MFGKYDPDTEVWAPFARVPWHEGGPSSGQMLGYQVIFDGVLYHYGYQPQGGGASHDAMWWHLESGAWGHLPEFRSWWSESINASTGLVVDRDHVYLYARGGNWNDEGLGLSQVWQSVKDSLPSGVEVFTEDGTWDWDAAGQPAEVEVLVVGGGGGAGRRSSTTFRAGGGGGGGVIEWARIPVNGSQSVTVGQGGEGATSAGPGQPGGDSTFGDLVALGGGEGGRSADDAGDGGSGGGSGSSGTGGTALQPGQTGDSEGLGNDGGSGSQTSRPGQGGGGARGSGHDGQYQYEGGLGLWIAGRPYGEGGSATRAYDGHENTGSGGSGGMENEPSGHGADGVVMVRPVED
jgi:hypothetical protein